MYVITDFMSFQWNASKILYGKCEKEGNESLEQNLWRAVKCNEVKILAKKENHGKK